MTTKQRPAAALLREGADDDRANDGLTMVVLHGTLAWMIWAGSLETPAGWAAFALTLAVGAFFWATRGRIVANGGLLPASWSKRTRMLVLLLICVPVGAWFGWRDAGGHSGDPETCHWIVIGLSFATLTLGFWRLLHERTSTVR